jgi:membrane dipeptidase
MTYFLVGLDTHMDGEITTKMDNCIEHVIATIEYIRQKTGSYENIAVGSDFDNMGNAPADLKDASYFPALLDRIKKIPSINEEEVAMITQKNALRVLREGWKRC